MKDNLSIVLKFLLRYFNISNNRTETEIKVRSHPDYPTLNSLCETIEEFGLKTYPTKVLDHQLKEIEGSFIAHIREGEEKVCAFVKKYSSRKVEYYSTSNQLKRTSVEAFHRQYTGIVVQLEKLDKGNPVKRIKRYKQSLSSLPLMGLIGVYIFILLWQFISNLDQIVSSKYLSVFLITTMVGVSITGLLLYRDWFSDSSFSEKICKSGKHVNCDTVLNSRFSKAFASIKWSDLGFIYFSGMLLIVVSGNIYIPILQALSFATSTYIFVSVYQQAFLIRKWCLYCLGVLVLLLIATVNSFVIEWESPTLFAMGMSLLYFLFIGSSVLIIKQKNRIQQELIEQTINYRKYKTNPKAFKALWLNEQRIITPVGPYNIILGNRSRFALRITVFLSLTCRYCGDTFYSLKGILKKQPEICFHVIPLIGSLNDRVQAYFMGVLFGEYKNGGSWKAYNTLESWYQGEFHKNIPKALSDITGEAEKFIDENWQHAKRNQISQFPSLFLQSRLKPKGYTLDEALSFKEILNEPVISAMGIKKEMIITK